MTIVPQTKSFPWKWNDYMTDSVNHEYVNNSWIRPCLAISLWGILLRNQTHCTRAHWGFCDSYSCLNYASGSVQNRFHKEGLLFIVPTRALHVHTHKHTHAHTHSGTHIHTDTNTHTCTYIIHTDTDRYTHIYTQTHKYAQTLRHAHRHIHSDMHTYAYTLRPAHTHIYTYRHI